MIEGNFYHNVRHGAWLYFDEKGEITKKEIFINGTLQGEPNLIKEDQEIRESQDQLEFEDMLPPRN